MANVEKISIALSGDMVALVRKAVDTGDYASSSEVIREALREWKARRAARSDAVKELRRLWDANPDQTGLELFDALCRAHPGAFHSGQLRTLQRRLRQWRAELTQRLVFGSVVDRQPLPVTSSVRQSGNNLI